MIDTLRLTCDNNFVPSLFYTVDMNPSYNELHQNELSLRALCKLQMHVG